MFLGLDLATNLGWCLGAGHDVPLFGSVRIPGEDDIGAFAQFYSRWATAKLEQLKAAHEALPPKLRVTERPMCIFEAPVLPAGRFNPHTQRLEKAQTSIATTRKLQGMAWETEKLCRDLGVDCREEFLQTIKKGLSGHGQADKTDMIRAARRAGIEARTSDEADAFGVWLVGGVFNYAKRHRAAWESKLYGAAPP